MIDVHTTHERSDRSLVPRAGRKMGGAGGRTGATGRSVLEREAAGRSEATGRSLLEKEAHRRGLAPSCTRPAPGRDPTPAPRHHPAQPDFVLILQAASPGGGGATWRPRA